jgi:hypothetical protein
MHLLQLLTVVQSANASKATARKSRLMGRSGAAPVGGATLGMEDPSALLMVLAGGPGKCSDHDGTEAVHGGNTLAGEGGGEDAEPVDDTALAILVRRMFGRLDVDGDGSVSWWEWQSVLCARLSGRNPRSVFVDPSDVLCIGLSAAHAAVRAHAITTFSAGDPMLMTSTSPSTSAPESESRGVTEALPFIKLNLTSRNITAASAARAAAFGATGPGLPMADLDVDVTDMPPAKAVCSPTYCTSTYEHTIFFKWNVCICMCSCRLIHEG